MTAAAEKSQPLVDSEITITRLFDAPRALVWQCFTEPEHMKEWWGPKGSTTIASNMDLRIGGTYRGAMRDPEGRVMWAKFVYREIVAPTAPRVGALVFQRSGRSDTTPAEPDMAA